MFRPRYTIVFTRRVSTTSLRVGTGTIRSSTQTRDTSSTSTSTPLLRHQHRHPKQCLARTFSMASASTLTGTATATGGQEVSIPRTMKGVVINKTGGLDVLEYKTDLPVPVPKEGEVLIKNEFVGVNYIDTYFRTGLYPSPLPLILGREAEGRIISLGPSGNFYDLTPSLHVVYLGVSSYAEYTVVPAAKVYAIPPSLSSSSYFKPGIAAASLLQGLTALTLIREAYPVQRGEWVLVHAAAGGVGLWLCQLLKKIGARTIATASTEEKMDLARRNGAEVLLNYKVEGEALVEKVLEITAGEGVSAVFDSTGKDQWENDLKVVRRKGTVVSYGNSSGPVPPIVISSLSAKNIKILRPTLFGYIATREEFARYVDELFALIAAGSVEVRVHEVYPLEEVRRAQADLEARRTMGKLLLRI